MFRLGTDLLVRLPRRALAVELLQHEQRWLPAFAPHLNLPIPAPLHVGAPMFGYPSAFSILPWLQGQAADLCYPDPDQARVLGRFLQTLHLQAGIDVWPAVEQAPENTVRGVPLAERAAPVRQRLERLQTLPGVRLPMAAIQQLWRAALAAPVAKDGKLAGVIDWGDITAGDAATDLASFWMLFADRSARAAGLSAYGADEALITRAQGWACSFALLLIDSSLADDGTVEHQRHYDMGYATLTNLVTLDAVD